MIPPKPIWWASSANVHGHSISPLESFVFLAQEEGELGSTALVTLETETWARVVLCGRNNKAIVDLTSLMARLSNGTLEAAVNTRHTMHAFQGLGLPFSSQARGTGPAGHSPNGTFHPVPHMQMGGLIGAHNTL